MLQFSEAEFAELSHRAPTRLLAALTEETSADPRALACRAALHLRLDEPIEALALSTHALRDRSKLDVPTAIRALIVRGTAAPLMFLDKAQRIHLVEALSLVIDNGLEGGDQHAGLLINWATAQGQTGDMALALQTLSKAEEVAEAMPASPLSQSHLQTIEFNRIGMTALPSEVPLRLAEFTQSAEAAGASALAARGHRELADVLIRNDLYTAGLLHAARSGALFKAADLPTQVWMARLQTARILRNLGQRERVQDLLAEPMPSPSTSGWAMAHVRRLILAGDYAEWTASDDSALAAYRDAVALLMPIIDRGPGLVSQAPLTDVLVGALMICRKTGIDIRSSEWMEALDHASRRLRGLSLGLQPALFLDLLGAWMCQDEEEVQRIYLELKQLEDGAQLPGAPELPAREALLGDLDVLLSQYLGDDTTPELDVAEYWNHVSQLTAEDDESVRAAYRRANLLPVLHRMLSRGQLDPWGRFEAIELARWGSLRGGLGVVAGRDERPMAMREAFLYGAATRGVTFPAALGDARKISWGRWPGGIYPQGRRAVPALPTLDLGSLLANGDWSEEPEVLQLYLRGHRLHWAFVDAGSGDIESGQVDISAQNRAIVRTASEWVSPEVGQLDRDITSELGAPQQLLPTIAAIRCCTGPFVDSRDLARDFAIQLPTRLTQDLDRLLSVRERPSMDRVLRAVGELFPPAAWESSDRPLLLSLSSELLHLPLGLATDGQGRHLLGRRTLALLPPTNTIAGMRLRRRSSEVRNWSVLVAGDPASALGFALRDPALTLREALINPDVDASGRTALVYKGHYGATATMPSAANVADRGEPGAVLTAGELLTAEGVSPARIALMCCRGAGLHFADEWGGIASALMVNGAAEVLAPSWPVIDSREAARFDDTVTAVIGSTGHLDVAVRCMQGALIDEWLSGRADAIGPHWWSGLHLLKG